MPAKPSDPRFRMRRQRFPYTQPAGAPHGYLDGLCWLARGILWIDGWLTLEPRRRLDVQLTVDGRGVTAEASCVTGPVVYAHQGMVVRRWFLFVDLGDELATASHVGEVSVETSHGFLQWQGGYDRLIAPDYLFRTDSFYPEMRRGLGAYVDRGVQAGRLDQADPVLRRNLALVDQQLAPPRGDVHEREGSGEMLVDHVVELGDPPDSPRVSLIVNLLYRPDLLEHHFLQFDQAGDVGDWEVILVFTPDTDTTGLDPRLEGLVDLYRVPVRALFLSGRVTWAAAVEEAVAIARGEILVIKDGHTLSAGPGGLTAVTQPLLDGLQVVTSPVVEHFDATVRSAGFEVQLAPSVDDEPVFTPVPVDDEAAETMQVDACGADCFALPRALYEELGGLAGVYSRLDYEAADLCLRAAAQGHPTLRLPVRFTRFIETAAPPPLPNRIGTDVWDLFLLQRRLWRRPETAGSGVVDAAAAARADGGAPRATVVIPTLNPGRDLVDVLDRLTAQEGAPDFEILVIDSSSRDGTRRTLEKRGIRHLVIERSDFNHGLTRNLGVREARGEIVALLSQDALPEPGWLAGLLEAFEDPSVAGAYSRQLPRPEASVFVKDQLSRWFAAGEEPRRQQIGSLKRFADDPLEDQLATVCFDNVSSAVRRSVALEIPFRALRFGEDRDWSYRVQAAGYAIRFCPASVVLHSHERSAWYEMRRTYVDHRLYRQLLPTHGEPTDPPAFLPWWRGEVSRLQTVAGRADSAWGRLRGRLSAPARAAAAVGGAYLAHRAQREVSSGSRSWRWLNRRLDQGL